MKGDGERSEEQEQKSIDESSEGWFRSKLDSSRWEAIFRLRATDGTHTIVTHAGFRCGASGYGVLFKSARAEKHSLH
jgi:hypothetical protein